MPKGSQARASRSKRHAAVALNCRRETRARSDPAVYVPPLSGGENHAAEKDDVAVASLVCRRGLDRMQRRAGRVLLSTGAGKVEECRFRRDFGRAPCPAEAM